MGFLGVVGEGRGNFLDGDLAVAVGLVEMSLHGHQINYAAESAFVADGKLQRDNVAPENLFQRFHGALKAC